MSIGQPVSVLIVEDNMADADLTVEGFAEAAPEASVAVAPDGQSALDLITQSPRRELPGLVVLDLNLPRLTGLQVLEKLKSHQRLRQIPVVVLTTSKSPREINASYAGGAAAVVNKPMRLAEHRAMIRALVGFWLGQVRLPDWTLP